MNVAITEQRTGAPAAPLSDGCIKCSARWSRSWSNVGTIVARTADGQAITLPLLLCHNCQVARQEAELDEIIDTYLMLRRTVGPIRQPLFTAN